MEIGIGIVLLAAVLIVINYVWLPLLWVLAAVGCLALYRSFHPNIHQVCQQLAARWKGGQP